MKTAKILKNGKSQTVKLPEDFRISSNEVIVNKIGDIVLLIPSDNKWNSFIQATNMLSDDFMSAERFSSEA